MPWRSELFSCYSSPSDQEEERATDGEPQDLEGGPNSLLWVARRTADPSPGWPALGFGTGSCGRVSTEPTAPGLNLFPGRNITRGDETQRLKPQESACMCRPVERGRCVREWLMPPSSEEALRSLPAPPPNCGSARPPREAAPCSPQGNTAVREGTSCILPLPASPGPAQDRAEPTQTPAAIFPAGPWSQRPHRKGAEVNCNKPWVTSARDLLAENLGSCPERRK